MAGTRSSARLASNSTGKAQSASPPQNKKTAGKRKAEEAASPPRKKGKAVAMDTASSSATEEKPVETKQMGIEQAIDNQAAFEVKGDKAMESGSGDAKAAAKGDSNGHTEANGQKKQDAEKADVEMKDVTGDEQDAEMTENNQDAGDEKDVNAEAHVKAEEQKKAEADEEPEPTDATPAKSATAKAGDAAKSTEVAVENNQPKPAEPSTDETTHKNEAKPDVNGVSGEAIAVSKDRAEAVPAEILEKGLIYFFIRGRVQTDNPHSVTDIQRTHMVFRPLPKGASLHEGSLPNDPTCRLLALPKKTLPKEPRDKFMVFTEKAKASLDDIKEFVSASDYSTASNIPRHTPAAKPVAEGIYAITAVNRTNYLAYMLTLPEEISSLQKDLGLASQGSFVLSTKNPEFPSPANAGLPTGPKYEQEILSEFNGLRWMPTKPVHMDYDNAQFLFIGTEGDSIDKAVDGVQGAKEEIEKLEGEDEIRVESLKGDEALFDDLQTSHKQMPKLASTW